MELGDMDLEGPSRPEQQMDKREISDLLREVVDTVASANIFDLTNTCYARLEFDGYADLKENAATAAQQLVQALSGNAPNSLSPDETRKYGVVLALYLTRLASDTEGKRLEIDVTELPFSLERLGYQLEGARIQVVGDAGVHAGEQSKEIEISASAFGVGAGLYARNSTFKSEKPFPARPKETNSTYIVENDATDERP